MKSKAEMSFWGEMFSCFCLAVHVIQKHDSIQITFTAYQTGNPLSSEERQWKARVPMPPYPCNDGWTERSGIKQASQRSNISSEAVI